MQGTKDILKRSIERAILMAKEGNLGIAAQCLQSLEMVEQNERALDQLIEMHPTGRDLNSKQLLSMDTALKTST